MTIEKQILGTQFSGLGSETFYSYNPFTGKNNDYVFYKSTSKEISMAAEKATIAFKDYKIKSGVDKATFLDMIAEEILNIGEDLVTTCIAETGLPAARIEGEKRRTINQLKMFATLLREGSWVDARIDTALPERTPLPRPDLRFMYRPIGPVAVFGASNFPLAFSVAGGDTASAFAAGCPVIVKAHPAHPATSALVGKAIQKATVKTNMPDGVFSLLFDNGIEAGLELVKNPLVKAVGFTGSFKAGKALYDAAVRRPEPIPVFAEMGSTNPVFILPGAIKKRGKNITEAFAASVTSSAGQFCTNPGILVHIGNDNEFENNLKTSFEKTTGGIMLAPYIFKAYNEGVQQHLSVNGVRQLAKGHTATSDKNNFATPALLVTTSAVVNDYQQLSEEVFGPSSMVIGVSNKQEMINFASNLAGQLTATVHGTEEDLIEYKELLHILEQKAGRIIINGFPTGVEVCSSMVHGGPFPATTDSRTTSVGTAAIYRFVKPVCFQNVPQSLLPEELTDLNPKKIYRLVNEKLTKEAIIKNNE